ncbi:LysM peptidoglycan-binding domain-containing protein [Prevotella sp. 10(H)]|uniref:LysM peptidoglycan-binding domain-containing protein n=1 Tax=Prevotella sp. 10(H) TaxID=1158294 RepID=UPI00350F4127
MTKTVSVPKTTTSYYKIRKGDTWPRIAKKNGVTVSELKGWNKTNKLIAGKSLKIEKIEYVEVQEPIKLPEPELPIVIIDSTYTADLIDGYLKKIVRDESTLPRVRISTTDSDSDRKDSDVSKIIYHKVKIGETITQIAARYNVTKKDIITWNKLSSNMAKVGQRLLILLPEQNASDGTNEGAQASSDKTSFTSKS